MIDISADMDAVSEGLQIASNYRLEVEVITFALYAMRNNPNITIEEAMIAGVEEWVK